MSTPAARSKQAATEALRRRQLEEAQKRDAWRIEQEEKAGADVRTVYDSVLDRINEVANDGFFAMHHHLGFSIDDPKQATDYYFKHLAVGVGRLLKEDGYHAIGLRVRDKAVGDYPAGTSYDIVISWDGPVDTKNLRGFTFSLEHST